MAGGSWTAQNKVRPGVYINFSTRRGRYLTVGTRGVLAGARALSWGPVGEIMRIGAGDNLTPYIGYGADTPQAQFLREAMKGTDVTGGPTTILLYRLAASGAAAASAAVGGVSATALYPGVRGNDISITVTEEADRTGTFTVATLVSGVQADRQTVTDASDLASNGWVSFSGEGPLEPSAGVALTGGADGTADSSGYPAFLEALEPYGFDILVYDGEDATVRQACIAFIKRIAAQSGRYAQLVTTGAERADSRFVVNSVSGVTLEDGTVLTPQQTVWWLAGAQAGAQYHQSLSYAAYPGAVDVSPRRTGSQIEEAVLGGNIVLSEEFGKVRIETDVNTLTTFTPEIGRVFHKNRTMRVCNTLANDIYREFSLHYLGKINNDENGRGLLKSAVISYLLAMYGAGALRQRPGKDDVIIQMGDAGDSVVIELALYLADSVETIYMTVTVA